MLTAIDLQIRVIQSGLCAPENLKGCTPKELHIIEEQVGHVLPKSYKEVMKIIGKGAGDFMSDLEMFYPQVIELTEKMRALIAVSLELPTDAYVFANRYGEQVLFFRLEGNSGDQEPVIYKWHDDEPDQITQVYDSFWDFIEEELQAHEGMLNEGTDDFE
jgi:SMI1 / KNR4 family (SUKH-1)